jgi:mannosyltransferase OCH1-like enzyme
MPEEYVRFGETWLEHHPGWEMRLWTESDMVHSRFKELADQCVSYATRSSLYRYEILHREGGIYVDTDFECLKSLEPLIADVDAFTAYQLDDLNSPIAVANGFFGAIPGADFLSEIMERVPRWVNPKKRFSAGPVLMTAVVRKRKDVRIFPRALFYPYLWTELDKRAGPFPDAYAVHHWGQMVRGVPWVR